MRNFFLTITLLSTLLLSSCSMLIKRGTRLYKEVEASGVVYDAIIVPGVPLKNGRWDSIMKARVLWSVYLYEKGITKNIIYSGAAVYTPFYEAVAMGLYAQKLGVPASHIFYDTLAKHSTENVYYSYLMAKQKGYKQIALATDPFQSMILKAFTRKRFATHIQHIPVNFDIVKGMNHDNPMIDSMVAYKSTFTSIVSQESLPTRLMGTFGRQIYFGPDKKLGPL